MTRVKEHITLLATSAMGLEAIVAREVRELGYHPKVDNGKITFKAPVSAIPRTNLWLRTADRVKVIVGEQKVESFEELYDWIASLPWEAYIPEDGRIPVQGKSHRSTLYSVRHCQSITKKAIVDRLKRKHGLAYSLPEQGDLYRVEISLLKDIATVTLDTSGEGLHKRGYRIGQGHAPLKETLAAALVLLTNWTGEDVLIDPMCGSGTIPIEAALIGQNIAPGFNRHFVSEAWDWIEQQLWDEAMVEAEDLAKYDRELEIHGYDIDHRMIDISRANALEAGLSDLIEWKQMQVKDLTIKEDVGYLISNPPYGERLKDREYVTYLYQILGEKMRKHPAWSVYILTSFKPFERYYGKKATKKRKLFNGFIETHYYQYFGNKNR